MDLLLESISLMARKSEENNQTRYEDREDRERLKILDDMYWDDMSKKQLVLKQLYWVLECPSTLSVEKQ